ncbi:purine-nucleoside phosphorylase [Sulfitobacter sp. SH24]|uniref:purine-nucleoside phosphorylase n=1 Tax=Sulfitobacter sp. SH24 TaxID=3421173 RepID=UPI003F50BE5B
MRYITAAAAFSAAFVSPLMAQERGSVAPKVLVVTMFAQEAAPWTENENLTTEIPVLGLSQDYPAVTCNDAGLCMMTTAMGFANAASSVSAVALSPKFDLQQTYVVIAGIAGVDPKDGTLGSAHRAKFAVDADLNHRIDPRETPDDWSDDTIGLGAGAPGEKPKWGSGTEVFALNPALAEFAYETTKDVPLADGEEASSYRTHYAEVAAQGKPFVSLCDTLSSDTYWHGIKIADSKERWVSLLTDDAGDYYTTQMENNATLTALKRADEAGLLDFDRVAVLRTGSNFDRQGTDQTAIASLQAKSGGFPLAAENAYRVAKSYAEAIMSDWNAWKEAPQVD